MNGFIKITATIAGFIFLVLMAQALVWTFFHSLYDLQKTLISLTYTVVNGVIGMACLKFGNHLK